jgi:hypothetical protein
MNVPQKTLSTITIALLSLVAPSLGWAHCDTLDGPVVADARLALAGGDVTPVLKWVRPGDETEVRSAFDRTLAVRGLSPDARELADTFFFENLVRIHRAGEGAPFTGLKPAGRVEPVIELADQALESGSVEKLSAAIQTHAAAGIEERFLHAASAKQNSEKSVAAGRAFVAAYVDFTHYVEALHEAVVGTAPHHQHSEQE